MDGCKNCKSKREVSEYTSELCRNRNAEVEQSIQNAINGISNNLKFKQWVVAVKKQIVDCDPDCIVVVAKKWRGQSRRFDSVPVELEIWGGFQGMAEIFV